MPRTTRSSSQQYGGQYVNITGTGTTAAIKSGSGILRRVIVNTPVATSVITLWDSLTASGAKIGTITIPASPQPFALALDAAFAIGLTVQVATAASDLTVTFE